MKTDTFYRLKRATIGAILVGAGNFLLITPAQSQNVFPAFGNVGIGTNVPATRLEVRRADGGFLLAKFTNAALGGDRTALVDIQNGQGVLWRYGVGGLGNGLGINAGQFYLERAGLGPVFTAAFNGNVGIGTFAPQQKLHVDGNEILSTGPVGGFKFRNRGSASSADDWVWYSFGNIARFWRAGYGDVIGITTAGNVGIGTNTPATRLEVYKNNGNPLLAKFTNGAVAGDRTALVDIQNGQGVLWRYGVGGAGNGLGINAGQFYLERSGLGAVLTIATNGNAGLGSAPLSTYKLAVCGRIRATAVRVNTGWCDYVFEDNYDLKPLLEVEKFIKKNKHLPDVPSAAEVERDGIELGEMNATLLRKIEELTLHMIEMKKENDLLKQRVDQMALKQTAAR
ncbi:MAG: hypothetical protein ACO1NZ_00875 [Adhaeribacter sp.]